jgi:4-amino-4-deoxy-L-arabinose transferase-like glycosyltransferase
MVVLPLTCKMLTQATRFPWLAAIIVSIHAVLLTYGAYSASPVVDEPAHLVAGLNHWETGTFRLYCVNPPLVRMIAAAPVLLMERQRPILKENEDAIRPEYLAADHFSDLNGDALYPMVFVARLACIPFSMLGGTVCFLWARRLYGNPSDYLALTLWCASPFILGHGALITPDVGAAAMAVLACYTYWRWLRAPSWSDATLAGFALGVALLSKTTLMLLIIVFPAVWAIQAMLKRSLPAWSLAQVAAIIGIGLLSLNAGYGFEGTGKRLGSYVFRSRLFFGSNGSYALGGNRFRQSSLEMVPLPLPENYVRGIDLQRFDFEAEPGSYLLGTWRRNGWWHYYLLGVVVKEPLALWLLVASAGVARFVVGHPPCARFESLLCVPAVAIFFLVSSQTGLNHHVRYVLAALPFLFVGVSQVASTAARWSKWCLLWVWGCVAWYCISSLSVVPYSLTYFNELAGGPQHGRLVLHNSSTDWGQGLFALKQWYDRHPEARPLHVKSWMRVSITGRLGMEWYPVPIIPRGAARRAVADWLPETGWYAISVNALHDQGGLYDYFHLCTPRDQVAYVWLIYEVTAEDIERIRGHYCSPM